MQAGFESPDHLRSIANDLWPIAATRIEALGSEALVALVEVVDDWIRLQKQLPGAFNATPNDAQAEAAREFLQLLLPAIATAASGKPAAQMALRDTTRLFRIGIRQPIDPEFRLLSWMPWRLPGRGKSGLIATTVEKLARCWAAEDPDVLMTRLAGWSAEAARRKRTIEPMIHFVFEALGRISTDVDTLIGAGWQAGLTWELSSLYRASIAATKGSPAWFGTGLQSSARTTVLRAALEQPENVEAASEAVDALTEADLFVVETALITRSRTGADEVAQLLLSHQDPQVRGYAALYFSLEAGDHGVSLPDDWYPLWAEAFKSAPLQSPRGHNYELGEKLRRLVDRDPVLAADWFVEHLRADPRNTLWELPDQAKVAFPEIPREQRDRIIRSVESGLVDDVLEVLVGDDLDWLVSLLDDGVVNTEHVLSTLNFGEGDVPSRVRRVVAIAPILVPRGVHPARLARKAEMGAWTGLESANQEALRAAFESVPADDPSVSAVRDEALRIFEAQRDEALREERERRVRGDL
jgi:hypothetical protein